MKSAIYKLKGVELKELKRESPLDEWFYEMVQKSMDMLTIDDISHMLRQEIYLDIAIPLACQQLLNNPLCGEMYDGQMLELLIRVFINNPDLKRGDFYVAFEKKIQRIHGAYNWDNEYERLLLKFKELFK